MSNYMNNGEKLIMDDSSLKAFTSCVFAQIPVSLKRLQDKSHAVHWAAEFLEERVAKTDIDYTLLLDRYKGELGDLIFQLWKCDRKLPKAEFQGTGAKHFFEGIVTEYIFAHFDELRAEYWLYESLFDVLQKKRMLEFIRDLAIGSEWQDEHVPDKIRSLFTSWCFLYRIDADAPECDKALHELYFATGLKNKDSENGGISYEDFFSYMVELVI